jgi:hypothetical protein
MTKYADIITVQDAEYFLPVFDITKEHENYWKQFVPTPQFYELLESALEVVSSAQPGKRKSLWVQGTFGTGKSHASSVIRHLLCDDWASVADYVNRRLVEMPEMAARLEQLRNGKRFFPVVLKGVQGGVHNTRTFELVLTRTIKDALHSLRDGKGIVVNSDFEKAIQSIENNPLLKLEEILPHQPKLKAIAKGKAEIIKRLESHDIELYLALEEALANYDIHLTTGNLKQWLSEVEKKIREKGIADGLLILWDEFSSVMENTNNGILNHIQSIAELSMTQNIYLFLISHRVFNAHGIKDEEVRKISDRFDILKYKMETNTTFRLMAAALKVLDETERVRLFEPRIAASQKLISYLTDNESKEAVKDIGSLFPMHPYTASLCSSLSNQIGSANRSVFEFINAEKGGFLGFVRDTDAVENDPLLTADWLWDFFMESFENDSAKYSVVTDTYNSRLSTVKVRGENYLKVFKGILLLNALRNISSIERVQPSQDNITRLFSGEAWSVEVETILDWFNQNQIIQKDPLDNFVIEFSALPLREVTEEKRRQSSQISNAEKPDAIKALSLENNAKEQIARILGPDELLRKSELSWLAACYDETKLNAYLKQAFHSGSSLHVALLLSVNEQEQFAAVEKLRKLTVDEKFADAVFVSLAAVLDNDGMQWERLVGYLAMQQVAQRHSLQEQADSNKKKVTQLLEAWALRIKGGNATVYFRGTEHSTTCGSLAKYMNEQVSHQIFTAGVETLSALRAAPMTFWKEQISKKAAEIMLSKQTRDMAEAEFRGQWLPAKHIFRDENGEHVVDDKMQIKVTADANHPLVQVQKKVDELIERARERRPGSFNLGTALQPLTEVPFGLYGTYPNMALLGFALRKYLGEFNNDDVGTTVSAEDLRDKVEDIFKFWRKENATPGNSLNVRFGTKAERDLRDMLVRLFDLTKIPETPELTSIKNVKWGIIKYCDIKAGKPLWSLKYADVHGAALRGVIGIVGLIDTEEIAQEKVGELLAALRESEYDILELVRKNDTYQRGFAAFVKSVENVQIKDEWMGELFAFLPCALQGSVGMWKEQEVREKVKDFFIRKINPQPESVTPSVAPQPPTQLPAPQPLPEKIEVARKKIQVASNIEKMRATLELVLEKFPASAEVIESNIE